MNKKKCRAASLFKESLVRKSLILLLKLFLIIGMMVAILRETSFRLRPYGLQIKRYIQLLVRNLDLKLRLYTESYFRMNFLFAK